VKTIAPVYLFGAFLYNLVDHWRVLSVYGVEYQAQCWSSGIAVEQWGRSPNGIQSSETKVQVYLTLLNISSIGKKSPYLMGL
jgi:hypothetical protein